VIQNRYDDDDVDESQFEGLDVRHWHKNSIVGQVLWKIDVINRGRDQLKVEIGIEQEEGASIFQKKARGKYKNEAPGAIVNGYSGLMCASISSCHYYHPSM